MLAYNLLQKQYLNLAYRMKFELSTTIIICRYNIIHKIFLCFSRTRNKNATWKIRLLVLCLMLLSSNAWIISPMQNISWYHLINHEKNRNYTSAVSLPISYLSTSIISLHSQMNKLIYQLPTIMGWPSISSKLIVRFLITISDLILPLGDSQIYNNV